MTIILFGIALALLVINIVLLISYSTKINFGKTNNGELQKLYQKEFKRVGLSKKYIKKLNFVNTFLSYFGNVTYVADQHYEQLTADNWKINQNVIKDGHVFLAKKQENATWPFNQMVDQFKTSFTSIVQHKLACMDNLGVIFIFVHLFIIMYSIYVANFASASMVLNMQTTIGILGIVIEATFMLKLIYIIAKERYKLKCEGLHAKYLFNANYFDIEEVTSLLNSLRDVQDLTKSANDNNLAISDDLTKRTTSLITLINNIIIIDNVYNMNAKLNKIAQAPLRDKFVLNLINLENRRLFITLSDELHNRDLMVKLFSNDEMDADKQKLRNTILNDLDSLISLLATQLNQDLSFYHDLANQINLKTTDANESQLLHYYEQFNNAGHYLTGSKKVKAGVK